jgi:hypothetical protein
MKCGVGVFTSDRGLGICDLARQVETAGRVGISHTVEYGDGWFPIVYKELDFGPQMLELERRCQAAGRPAAPVTVAIWEVDEPLMQRCAELGVDRCVVVYHAEDKDGFPAFPGTLRAAG